MKHVLIALSAIAAGVMPNISSAYAVEKLIWQSAKPTAMVTITDRFGSRNFKCFATIRREADGSRYRRNIDCPVEASGYSDIGMPMDRAAVSMGKYCQADTVRVVHGQIILSCSGQK